MLANLDAFNIYLLTPTANSVRGMRPVTVLDIFEGLTKNFHPDGLFSLETFGRVGEEKRNRIFSYIDLKVPVLHPVIFKALSDLKGLYRDILAGKAYAVFNENKDFEESTALEGDTGYEFFIKHLPELVFEERPSPRRQFNIRLIEKHKESLLMDKHVVLPAGMRDYIVDQNGKPSEDEINPLYRRLLSLSSMVTNVNVGRNLSDLDAIRFNIQTTVQEIYEYIVNILEGKSGFMLGKWASRLVANTTRNVITSYVNDNDELFGPKTVNPNQAVIGLYQFLRMTLPLSTFHLREKYLTKIFTGPENPALLIDKKTLKSTQVNIASETYDEWMTNDGIEKFFSRYGEDDLRHEYLEVDGHYLALIYKGEDMTFRIFHDIDDLPEGFDPKNVHPVTYTELLYVAIYEDAHKIPCTVTRYPAIEYGSVYPGYTYLKTTARGEMRTELGDDWTKTEKVASEFPIYKEGFFNSASPNPTHLKTLGADFDGDTCSFQAMWTDESRQDVSSLLDSREYYVGLRNNLVFSSATDVSELVLASMTGE